MGNISSADHDSRSTISSATCVCAECELQSTGRLSAFQHGNPHREPSRVGRACRMETDGCRQLALSDREAHSTAVVEPTVCRDEHFRHRAVHRHERELWSYQFLPVTNVGLTEGNVVCRL